MLWRSVGVRVLLTVALCGTAGCMFPVYRNPGGFSSTYHRQVYGPERYAEHLHQPPSPPPPAEGVFFPSSVEYNPRAVDQMHAVAKEPPKRIVLEADPPARRARTRR